VPLPLAEAARHGTTSPSEHTMLKLLSAAVSVALALPITALADGADDIAAIRKEMDAMRAAYEARLQALERRLQSARRRWLRRRPRAARTLQGARRRGRDHRRDPAAAPAAAAPSATAPGRRRDASTRRSR
jgi:hypothetical protein